jgi:ectoine hydroxylase-related dioxygenase (phytanoyl-CoA dioxygenase family)
MSALEATPLPALISNGQPLSAQPNRLGWLTPHRLDEGIEALRARYHRDGHLWVKGLLPREDVLAFRGRVFAHFADAGLLKPGTLPRDGIAADSGVNAELCKQRLMEFVRSTLYERFCMHPALADFVDQFLDGLTYLHKRKIMRYTRPSDRSATGAHYDLIYLRGGTERLLTAWIPIGDVPVEMGGLVYLEGSHSIGRRMEAEFREKNADLSPEEQVSAFNKNMNEGGWLTKKLADLADRFDARWLMANYEAGDVVFHSPYMIHAATQNDSAEGRMRLSTDIRFQRVRDEIDARWANHWTLDDML